MKSSKFTEGQIAFVLEQGDESTPVAEICRKAGSKILRLEEEVQLANTERSETASPA